jgi:serine protease
MGWGKKAASSWKQWRLMGLFLMAGVLASTLSGCGSGGGDGATSTPPAAPAVVSVTLGGTVFAPTGIAIDSDVNDFNEAYFANDTLATAQPIANPIALAGYVNVAQAGSEGRSRLKGDRNDYFRVCLNEDDRIFLAIGDSRAPVDLDLYLYDAGGVQIGASKGTGSSESLIVEDNGTYVVRVYAYAGASNYILTIGPHFGDTAKEALSTEQDFVPGQAIVRFADEPMRGAAATRTLANRADNLGLNLKAGEPGRAVLLAFGNDQGTAETFKALGAEPDRPAGRPANDDLQRKLDTLRVIKQLRQRPDVIFADPNYILRHHGRTPDDTHYPRQWHYPMINLPQAWDITTGSSDVVVAVVDTGVLMGHPDLQGQLTDNGYDFIRDPEISRDGTGGIDPDPDDPGDGGAPGSSSFHGTHTAGTIAAATNNGRGVAGVGWNTRIMPIRVLGRGGGTLYDLLQGVRYAAGLPNDAGIILPLPADIINMSLGGGSYSQAAQDVFDQVRAKGIILIAAAGNESSRTASYPAAHAGVISVSALNISSTLASYSNYGLYIDVAAPGGDSGDIDGDGYSDRVWSTCGDDSSGTIQFNYAAYNGTSMAAPHVAGVVALMKAVRPTLTPGQLDDWLAGGLITNDIGAPGRDDAYGHGVIDAHKAVIAAIDNPSLPALLRVDPASLNFGTTATRATVTVSQTGTGPLGLTHIATTASWLQVVADNVDADGLGAYTVQVDRDAPELAGNGTYIARITFTPTEAGPVVVAVTLQVVSAAGTPDAGYHYVLLMNADTYELVDQVGVRAQNGRYAYVFTNVPQGRYTIFAGSDRDNDGYIDNAGESFGAYGSMEQISIVHADQDLSGLDFTTDLKLFLPAASHFEDRVDRPVLQRIH